MKLSHLTSDPRAILAFSVLLRRFINIHSNKYSYEKAVYLNTRTPIEINCPIHGYFWQKPQHHLAGKGCKKCQHNSTNRKTNSSYPLSNLVSRGINFIKNANYKHHGIYDYSQVRYININTKVNILCNFHGMFSQVAGKHLQGQGCRKCALVKMGKDRTLNTVDFISKAKHVHGEVYDYRNSDYINSSTKLEINCLKHGIFYQVPNDHLRGVGCPICKKSGFKEYLPAILYYLHVSNTAYKIGITNKSLQKRFCKEDLAKIRVVQIWEYSSGEEAYLQEQKILKEFKDNKYEGIQLLESGNSELFKSDVLCLDKSRL